MKKVFLFFGILATVFLSACQKNPPENPKIIEKIPISKTGKIEKKPLTIFEDGTHFLETENGEKLLLKSSVVDLSDFENRLVTVVGEQKAEKDAPIEVFQIDLVRPPIDARLAKYAEKDFGILVSLPASWTRDFRGKVLRFSPPDADPAIEISRGKIPKTAKKIREIFLDGAPAQKIIDGEKIFVFSKGVQFAFFPQRNPDLEKFAFFEMLENLKWISPEKIPAPDKTPKIACGGAAKKLCPTGFRCDLDGFDPDAAGVCVDAKIPPKSIDAAIDAKVFSEKSAEKSFQKEAVPADFAKYENRRFSYFFRLPKTFHWRHLGARGDAMSVLQIAPAEVTDENVFAEIRVKKDAATPTEKMENGKIKIKIPRDEKTHFEIIGDAKNAEILRQIASGISF